MLESLYRKSWLSVLVVTGLTSPVGAQTAEEPSVAPQSPPDVPPDVPSDSPAELPADSPSTPPAEAAPATPEPTAPATPSAPPVTVAPPTVESTPPTPSAAPPTATFPTGPATGAIAPSKPRRVEPQRPAAKAPAQAPAYQDAPFDNADPASSSATRDSNEPPKPEAKEEDSSDIIRLGPVVGVGLPGLFSFGGLLKLTSYLGGGVNVSLIPSTKVSFYGEATLSYQEYDVYGRIFPFGGGFFMGGGVGYATVKGSMKNTFDTSTYAAQAAVAGVSLPGSMSYDSQGSVRTMVVTPQIGYFYTTSIGFSIGLDLGAQVPVAPSEIKFNSKFALPAGTPAIVASQIQSTYVAPLDKKVEDTLQTIGRAPLPTINLRVGWLI